MTEKVIKRHGSILLGGSPNHSDGHRKGFGWEIAFG
jgi:hypothetical protein